MELISEWFVKPKHEVKASKEPINLTPLEIFYLRINPIQSGLLYTLDPNTPIDNLLDDLKHSLSLALIHFHPLAGRLVTETVPDEQACTVFVDCNKGPGARLTHVVAKHLVVPDLLSPTRVPVIVGKLFELGEDCLDYEGHTRALVSIQVTELVDGVFFGFTANHSVVDGMSFIHFFSMLSEIFKTITSSTTSEAGLLEISRVPVYEKQPVIKLPYLGLKELMTTHESEPSVDRVFYFSPSSMAMIKARANEGNDQKTSEEEEGESVSDVSSFQGLLSLAWRSITRARNLSSDQETDFEVPLNSRPRVDPPLSDDYVGNYISPAIAKCTVGELLGHDLGWVAKRLNDAIRSKDAKSIKDGSTMLARLAVMPGILNWAGGEFVGPNSRVFVGGSPRIDIYGLEFGLGRAIASWMGPGNKTDGKVNAIQGREGVGSVGLEITLKEEHMTALEADSEFMSFIS